MAGEKNLSATPMGAGAAAVEAPLKTWGKVVKFDAGDYSVDMYVVATGDRDFFDLIIRVGKGDVVEEHYGVFDAWKLDVDVDSEVARDVVAILLAHAIHGGRKSGVDVRHADAYYGEHGDVKAYYIDGGVYAVKNDRVYFLGTLRDAEEFIPEEFDESEKEFTRQFVRALKVSL